MIDLKHYAEHGYVRLTALLPSAATATMADALWQELRRRHGISRTDRSTWTIAEPRGLGALRKAGAFNPLATPEFITAINTLLANDNWPRPTRWGDPLVTFPIGSSQWNVPTSGWHIDYPARANLLLKWLAYLAPVAPGGGGTVVLAGSHRLVGRHLRPGDPGRSPVLRDAIFGSHPWLRAIREPDKRNTRQGATVDGVPLRIVELSGQPGDVVFLHPHLFHAPAPNCGTTPRLMVTGGVVASAGG